MDRRGWEEPRLSKESEESQSQRQEQLRREGSGSHLVQICSSITSDVPRGPDTAVTACLGGADRLHGGRIYWICFVHSPWKGLCLNPEVLWVPSPDEDLLAPGL